MKKDFYQAIEDRRSIYGINKEPVVSEERIQEVVNHAVLHTPSAFNSQNARVLVLFGEQHDKLWDITMETLRKVVPEGKFGPTEEKLNSFKAGGGTILYFEDLSVVEDLQQRFPLYKDNFPLWSLQSVGMLQLVVWTALELEGLGASLQHYNPLIDEGVRQQWNVPQSWRLIAQMPFGKPVAAPEEKEFLPLEERVRIYQ
jgi:predicted oxidoreductase (fatty acid repression mutant protein)